MHADYFGILIYYPVYLLRENYEGILF